MREDLVIVLQLRGDYGKVGSLEKLESHDTREQARKEIITLVQQELTQETLPLVLKARTGMQGSSLTSRWS